MPYPRHPVLLVGIVLLLSTSFFTAVNAAGPSFDCRMARSWSEKAVCSDSTLAALDVQVATLYRSARGTLTGAQREGVKNDQKAWLREREGCKGHADASRCLLRVYKTRIAQLGVAGGGRQESSGTGDIRAIDFRNFTYDLGKTWCAKEFGSSTVEVRDGEYGDFRDMGFSVAADRIVYGDLTGDGRDEAVVITYCGGMHSEEQAFVYGMKGGRAVLLTKLDAGNRADGGIVRPHLCRECGDGIAIHNGMLTVERMHGEAACCPEYVEKTTFRWDGKRLVQIGEGQRRKFQEASAQNAAVVPSAPTDGSTLTSSGTAVRYAPAAQGALYAEFSFDSKGHRNTYTLDCKAKRFRWTENRHLASGKVTGNSAGAEWKPMNPRSTITNAVYAAVCPRILAQAASGGTSIATSAEPPAFLVDKGACPSEGCTYGRWRAGESVSVRTNPKDDSPIIGSIEKGESVEALTGEVHVTPSRFVVRRAHGKYKKGDVIWVYTFAGEGIFKVWFAGEMYDEDLCFSPYGGSAGSRCEADTACWGELEKEHQSTWWVQVRKGDGTTGWIADTEHFTGKSMYDNPP